MRFINLHLTIYFIGNINAEDFEKVLDAVGPIINLQKIFLLHFENISFAPVQNPKMIWARFHKSIDFTNLVNSIHEALKSIVPGVKFYYKEPVPHITLARFPQKIEFKKINIERVFELSQIEIITCAFMESFPSPEGVIYKKATPSFLFQK